MAARAARNTGRGHVEELAAEPFLLAPALGDLGDPEGPSEAGGQVAVAVVPGPAQRGVGRVVGDRVDRERQARAAVVDQVSVAVDLGAARVRAGRVLEVLRHWIAPVARSDLELHALEEELVSALPDLLGEPAV